MRLLEKLIANLGLVLSLMVITLLIVDHINPTMDFINNSLSKSILLALCICALASGLLANFLPPRKR